ncbi:hypothetical protein [Brevundimonas aurifodinae]|uniref:Uncharacterized protein n=2 Tax=Brevundimonas TaxID=41275 RepID=A0ABV1NJI5_9CAUL|nr:MAG: hypothetical protein B7Z42_03510 [Brevundimonas sp. 12-68-7]OYX29941.1 MAG: hypothetical protein B7Z01_15115 [Brevundimonas subvibrioides]
MSQPTEPRRKITLLWVVESLSTASGIAFLASAIAHATAFHMTWGLNYFAVASPTDVVMGAFNPLLLVLGPAVAIMLAGAAVTVAMNVAREGPKAALEGVVERTVGLFTPLRLLVLSLASLMVVVAFSDVFVPRPGRPPSWLYTGLSADAPSCAGASVQWLGSQSAILDCGGEVRVERRDALKLRVARA